VQRLVVASSRAIYGEGAYLCVLHGEVYPAGRDILQMKVGNYETKCPLCAGPCTPAATPESAPCHASSFYGLTKQVQEQMVLLFGNALRIPAIALRYQNVYGPGQSLINPYTGILAVFSNLARLDLPIRVFEDGLPSRDFVYIDDVVEATCKALTAKIEGSRSINVGSGQATSVIEVARQIVKFYRSSSDILVTGEFRLGDIRHGRADLTRARDTLGFHPQWTFQQGLEQFLHWAIASRPDSAGYERSLDELRQRGLMNA
jgi:dTDP-L-rhamnose 4-epimerase